MKIGDNVFLVRILERTIGKKTKRKAVIDEKAVLSGIGYDDDELICTVDNNKNLPAFINYNCFEKKNAADSRVKELNEQFKGDGILLN